MHRRLIPSVEHLAHTGEHLGVGPGKHLEFIDRVVITGSLVASQLNASIRARVVRLHDRVVDPVDAGLVVAPAVGRVRFGGQCVPNVLRDVNPSCLDDPTLLTAGRV